MSDDLMEDDRILLLIGALQAEANEFPWTQPRRSPRGDWENMWWWWNTGFVHAAGRLARAVTLLNSESLSDEAMLPLRSLLELVGNQGYMAQEPETRALQYAQDDLRGRERTIQGLIGLGAMDSVSLNQVLREIDEVRLEMADVIEDIEPTASILPFGRKARVRTDAAGLAWHYDGIYVTASDFVHMNARAVAQYVSRLQGDREEQAPRMSTVVMASELLLRSLYFADWAVDQGRADELDALGRLYAALALPDRESERVVNSLRPPQIRTG
jgi:hypothetical protein